MLLSRPSLEEALAAARETRALLIGSDVLTETPRIFREQVGELSAVLVSDPQTMVVAGEVVQAALRAAGQPLREPFVFPDADLYAESRFVEQLEASLREHSAIPIAIGSGTLNDLTKLAAHRVGRPYLCVATAASMDGYTAYGASITHEGSKQTFDCPAPRAVIADLKVIAGAPAAMNAWGYADLLAKVTAGADWILADALGLEPIDPLAWNIVQGGLREAVANPAGVRTAQPEALGSLVEGLMLGGFAMQAHRTSRPASGAEHQFSHLWDMQHHTHEGIAPSHGLKVGIGTLAVTSLYEALLAEELENLDVDRCCATWPEREAWVQRAESMFTDDEVRMVAIREIQAKCIDRIEFRRQLETLRSVWPELQERLWTQLIPWAELRTMLENAGAATEPAQIGITRERLRDSFWQAFFIRRRFTVLDVAAQTGLLDSLLSRLFSPGGCWSPPF